MSTPLKSDVEYDWILSIALDYSYKNDDIAILPLRKLISDPILFFEETVRDSNSKTIPSQLTPIGILMTHNRESLIWKYIDQYNIQIHEKTILSDTSGEMSILSLAASENNVKFIEEWHKRGLPIELDEPCSPLIHAMQNLAKKSLFFLSSIGAKWRKSSSVTHTITSLSEKGFYNAHKIHFQSTPLAIGLVHYDSSILNHSNAQIKDNIIDDETWQTLVPPPKIPHSTHRSIVDSDSSKTSPLPLHSFLPSILNQYNGVVRTTHENFGFYEFQWWKYCSKSGFINNYLNSKFVDLKSWDKITEFRENSVYPEVFYGITKKNKIDTSDYSLSKCLESMRNSLFSLSTDDMNNMLFKRRAKLFWDSKTNTGQNVYNSVINHRTSNQAQSLIPIFCATVFCFFESQAIWENGCDDKLFSDQFWTFLPTFHESTNTAYGRSTSILTFPLDFSENYEKTSLSLDKFSKTSTPDAIFASLSTIIKNNTSLQISVEKNILFNKIYSIAQVLKWGVCRKIITADSVLKLIDSATNQSHASLSRASLNGRNFQALQNIKKEIEDTSLYHSVNAKTNKTQYSL